MAIDWPASPTAGDTYTYQGKTYTFDANGSWQFTSISFQTVNQLTSSLPFFIDGGGSAITTGIKGGIYVPFNCTILSASALVDQSGSIVIDIWNDVIANYPPTDADSITASAPVTITTDTDSLDATLTGWTTAVSVGDVIYFNVDSITTCEWCMVQLNVLKG